MLRWADDVGGRQASGLKPTAHLKVGTQLETDRLHGPSEQNKQQRSRVGVWLPDKCMPGIDKDESSNKGRLKSLALQCPSPVSHWCQCPSQRPDHSSLKLSLGSRALLIIPEAC